MARFDNCYERVRNIVLCEEEPRELPAEMNFDDGYDHLTAQQRAYLTKKLAPEGSFFLKGKYPNTVRTPVIIDVQGAPPKASGYQRLSEKEQEVVNSTWRILWLLMSWNRALGNGRAPFSLFQKRTAHSGQSQTYGKSTNV